MPSPRKYRAERHPEPVVGPGDDHPDFLDWLQRLQTHFGRFTWDASGVILLALALMVLLVWGIRRLAGRINPLLAA